MVSALIPTPFPICSPTKKKAFVCVSTDLPGVARIGSNLPPFLYRAPHNFPGSRSALDNPAFRDIFKRSSFVRSPKLTVNGLLDYAFAIQRGIDCLWFGVLGAVGVAYSELDLKSNAVSRIYILQRKSSRVIHLMAGGF